MEQQNIFKLKFFCLHSNDSQTCEGLEFASAVDSGAQNGLSMCTLNVSLHVENFLLFCSLYYFR
jgi:hypothetical protein